MRDPRYPAHPAGPRRARLRGRRAVAIARLDGPAAVRADHPRGAAPYRLAWPAGGAGPARDDQDAVPAWSPR
jgi:hypothetical protein